MDMMQLLTANIWVTIVLLLFIIAIVSIVLGILLEFYKINVRSQQKMLELRNEELRLQLQLGQQKKDKPADSWAADIPVPKDEPSWVEQPQASYKMGYEQRG